MTAPASMSTPPEAPAQASASGSSAAPSALRIAVVGHTNAGKTSLLRTLTRRAAFGEVSDRPGVTRHVERIDLLLQGEVAVRFFDTPGLEDAVALLDYLQELPAQSLPAHPSRTDRVRAFLSGPEAHASFEQEAKVLRALLEHADAAMLVIDTRAPVLPKYRAEMEALAWCARPIMPVLNFVRAAGSRQDGWRAALRDAGLHACAAFDAVAPFNGAETALYRDLAALLPERRRQLEDIARQLEQQAQDRQRAARLAIASALVSVAAMRRSIAAGEYADPARRDAFIHAFQQDCAAHARRAAQALLRAHAFGPEDAEAASLPQLAQRWEDDLFNPALLKEAGRRLGLGAAIGAGIGAVADVALAGLSLGAAATLGGAIGSALSGGWQPLAGKLRGRLTGTQELTAQDAVLALLAARLLALNQALTQRGHAAQHKLRAAEWEEGSQQTAQARQLTATLADALRPARAHPDWEERPGAPPVFDPGRDALTQRVARLLPAAEPETPAASPGAARLPEAPAAWPGE